MSYNLPGILVLLAGLIFLSAGDGSSDFYTFSVTDVEGSEVSLEKYRGTVSNSSPISS